MAALGAGSITVACGGTAEEDAKDGETGPEGVTGSSDGGSETGTGTGTGEGTDASRTAFPLPAVTFGPAVIRDPSAPPKYQCYVDGGITPPTSLNPGPSVSVLGTYKEPSGSGWGDVTAITSDANYIYWTLGEAGSVMRRPKSGGNPEEIMQLDNPGAIVVDAANAYVGAAGVLIRVPFSNAPKSIIDTNGVTSITQDATHLYYTTNLLAGVAQWAKAGGEPLLLDVANPSPQGGIAFDAKSVYWANSGGNAIHAVPIGGGTVRTIASDQRGANGLVIDKTRAYWTTTAENGTVSSASLTGGAVTVLARNTGVGGAIAIDGTTLYVSEPDLCRVVKMSTSGGPLMVVAYPVYRPSLVLVDGDFVYWTTEVGDVMRKRK
jgi:hypothetical protein